jgi:hypothetical protein
VISVGSPGSDGSVMTEGRCGNAPGDGELLVGVPVSALEVGVVDGVLVSVLEVGVVDVVLVSVVGAVVVALVVVGVVVVVVTGAGGGGPWASWMMPQMISATRTAISTPHPTSAIGLRHPGMGSSGSGC